MKSVSLCVLALGCAVGAADVTTTDTTDDLDPPDLAGRYASALLDTSGCEAFPEVPLAWVTGPLVVSGPPDALLFSFAGAPELAGSVDATYSFQIDDAAVVDGWPLVVFALGLAYIGDDAWVLDGDLDVDWEDPADSTRFCTLSGTLEATQGGVR